jgi:flagellar L-ring protein precursor FlgH
MNRQPTLIAASVILVSMAGCATRPLEPSRDFAPVFPMGAAKPQAISGSLFDDSRSDSFYGLKRRYQIGDQLTVTLNESTQATRSQNTTTARTSTNDALPSVQAGVANALSGFNKGLASAATQLNMAGNKITSDGNGTAAQAATLTGAITVTVTDVFPNGSLAVRGEKILRLSEGTEIIQVSGIVKLEDIAPNNTVNSARLANSQISYRGTGELANASQAGWATNFLYRFWPF